MIESYEDLSKSVIVSVSMMIDQILASHNSINTNLRENKNFRKSFSDQEGFAWFAERSASHRYNVARLRGEICEKTIALLECLRDDINLKVDYPYNYFGHIKEDKIEKRLYDVNKILSLIGSAPKNKHHKFDNVTTLYGFDFTKKVAELNEKEHEIYYSLRSDRRRELEREFITAVGDVLKSCVQNCFEEHVDEPFKAVISSYYPEKGYIGESMYLKYQAVNPTSMLIDYFWYMTIDGDPSWIMDWLYQISFLSEDEMKTWEATLSLKDLQ